MSNLKKQMVLLVLAGCLAIAFPVLAEEPPSPKNITPPQLENDVENEVRFNNETVETPSGEKETVPTEDRNPLKAAAEDVKEKLNLDEPVPESTKKFFRQLKGEEPIENEDRQ